jgi:hypothetical protein
MTEGLILHAGPDLDWDDMCEAQKKGGINGALFEGYAASEDEARSLLEKGTLAFRSANDYRVVGPGSGIVTPSMVVNIVEDRYTGKRGFCAPFEGPNRGGLSGWGAYNPAIKTHLEKMKTIIGPAFTDVLEAHDGLSLRQIFARGIEMGDELHSRQDACGLMAVNTLMKWFFDSNLSRSTLEACVTLMYGTVRYFYPLGMASAMALLEGIRYVPYATVVTAMAGNGVTYGIKVSGTGDRWYTAPSPHLEGTYMVSDVKQEDVLPWIGDSCLLEATGLGGFAAAAAPAVMRARGKTWSDGIAQTEEMQHITLDHHDYYLLPGLDYQGTPIGMDIRKVLRTGIEPIIHGGIISKSLRRIGAGAARVPMACFEKALLGFAEHYHVDE